jgi:hypothetical protein
LSLSVHALNKQLFNLAQNSCKEAVGIDGPQDLSLAGTIHTLTGRCPPQNVTITILITLPKD